LYAKVGPLNYIGVFNTENGDEKHILSVDFDFFHFDYYDKVIRLGHGEGELREGGVLVQFQKENFWERESAVLREGWGGVGKGRVCFVWAELSV
jgi:hypothetical protein